MLGNLVKVVGKVVTDVNAITNKKGELRVDFTIQFRGFRDIPSKAKVYCYHSIAKLANLRCRKGALIIIDGELVTDFDKTNLVIVAKDIFIPFRKKYTSGYSYKTIFQLYDPMPIEPPIIDEQGSEK